MNAKEIATVTGVEYATVKVQIGRAKKHGLIQAPAAKTSTKAIAIDEAKRREKEQERQELNELYENDCTHGGEWCENHWTVAEPGEELEFRSFEEWHEWFRSLADVAHEDYQEARWFYKITLRGRNATV